ncbi:MAG: SGNH/GDSL hydrolase family protein [Chloroflexi bacterium]|nr:SGNH/GDSL hydrolase family protein [Chloroflexota bacterium]
MARLLILIALLAIVITAFTPSASWAFRRHPRHGKGAPRAAMADPIIPAIDATLKSRLRAILADGVIQGNRATVFAKLGDSITDSGSFLSDIGCNAENLGDHSELAPMIASFRATTFPNNYAAVWCGVANSFTRSSAGAVTGWSANQLLGLPDANHTECHVGESALTCELRVLKPAIALIMVGTNDLERFNDLPRYRTDLTHIITETVEAGVIPVLSTLPPRLDDVTLGARVAPYNQVVREVAQAQQIPLWNFWQALQGVPMINQGISEDGVHPNLASCDAGVCAADFTTEGLRYGYNQRNFTALQMLAKLKQIVIDDGAPDSADPVVETNTPTETLPATPVTTTTTTPTFVLTRLPDDKGVYLPLINKSINQATLTPTPLPSATSGSAAPTTTPTPLSVCSVLPAGPITYVALGDSLTEGDGDELALGGFPGRLLEDLQTLRAGSTLANLGKSGWTSDNLISGVEGQAGELDQAVALLNQAKAAGHPRIATVWIGSNDLWYLYEYGNPTPADETQDLAHFTNNLETILSQLQATGASILIALGDDQAQRPVAISGAFPGTSAAELTLMSEQVARYNSAIRTSAAAHNAAIVDFFHTTIFTNPATLADDGNHPNAAGYAAITEQWFAAIQPQLGVCNAR